MLDAGFARLHVTWMELLQAQHDNSEGVQIKRFTDHVIATAAVATPDVQWLQHVTGVTPDDAALVPDIVGWYRDMGVRPRFEISSAEEFEPMAAALAAQGLVQTGFTDVLFGRPSATQSAVEVRPVEVDSDEPLTFGRILIEGHEAPFEHGSAHHLAASAIARQPDDHAYLAWVDGEPVGQAFLVMHYGVGFLANASVVPSGRRRGAQAALLYRRLTDANTAGCELVASMAVPGGISHRNLERAGLQVGYAKVNWTMR